MNQPAAESCLLFVLDDRGWAFDNIRTQISAGLADRYNCDAVYVAEHPDLADVVVAMAAASHVHVFWLPQLVDLFDPVVVGRAARRIGCSRDDMIRRLARPVLTATVYDHMGLRPGEPARLAAFAGLCDGFAVASPLLDAAYRQLPTYPVPLAVLPDGVDLSRFRRRSEAESGGLGEGRRPLAVGWVGDSRSGAREGIPDLKGVATVLRPALELLAGDGVSATLMLLDRAERLRPRSEVAAAYQTMDVLVCASLTEGTPNPVLEAMASGVAVVATDVGIVRLLFGPAQAAFIIPRTPAALAAALKRLAEDPVLRARLAAENIASIRNHSWDGRWPLWRRFFTNAGLRAAELPLTERIARIAAVLAAPPASGLAAWRSRLRRVPALYGLAARLYHYIRRQRPDV
jgi:glycosyltransferase involved in cell wall biosynthesis